MLPTYAATLRDGRLEWTADAPPPAPTPAGLQVHVTVLDLFPPDTAERRARALAALERLAAEGGLSSIIPDPLAWEREQREDRVLPGRES